MNKFTIIYRFTMWWPPYNISRTFSENKRHIQFKGWWYVNSSTPKLQCTCRYWSWFSKILQSVICEYTWLYTLYSAVTIVCTVYSKIMKFGGFAPNWAIYIKYWQHLNLTVHCFMSLHIAIVKLAKILADFSLALSTTQLPNRQI